MLGSGQGDRLVAKSLLSKELCSGSRHWKDRSGPGSGRCSTFGAWLLLGLVVWL